MRALVLITVLFAGGAAFARKPQEFVAPREMTQEELEAVKSRPKNPINAWGEDVSQKPTPVPWGMIGFLGLALLAATPFAIRMYNNTSKELSGSASFGANRGAVDDE